MMIHIVQPNETIYSIAQKYNILPRRLEQDNNLPGNSMLNVGQALMIVQPQDTYIVKDGDTYASIAESQGISVQQLLRNNIFLSSDQRPLFLGEELIISYPDTDKSIEVNGYAPTYISKEALLRNLPFLTYITIYNFKATPTGSFIDANDTEIIRMALMYGVKPIMFLSTMTEQGKNSYGTTHVILNDPKIQDLLIDNVLIKLKTKEYHGLTLAFHSIIPEDVPKYVDFVKKTTETLNKEGFEVFVSLTPSTINKEAYKPPYLSEIGQAANSVILMTYLWASAEISQVAETTVSYLRYSLDYIIQQVPPEKIFLGFSRFAYDWELPYVAGDSASISLTYSGAMTLANQLGRPIYFDEETQTPYFYYNDSGVEHYVWYKDVRSIQSVLNLIDEYGLRGVAVWNIMPYYSPTWLAISSQYNIVTLP